MSDFKLLMCPPKYYEVAYEINAWMSVKRQVSIDLAKKQWDAYYELVTKTLGIKVELVEPAKGLPDMVFTANAGLVHNDLFVLSNFRHKERRGEEPYFEKWARLAGYKIKRVDEPFDFEGEGDALMFGSDYYMGYHFRSDIQAHDQISGMLKTPYFGLELCQEHFYHLDTCFAPLNDESALAFLPAFEAYSQMILHENIRDLIQVPEEEAKRFACNALVFEKNVVMCDGCPETKEELEKRGFKVFQLDFSEFIKAGGAAKCLVLKL